MLADPTADTSRSAEPARSGLNADALQRDVVHNRSQGVPMILCGDEVLRSQRGNNNGYCEDNAHSWFDWRVPGTEPGALLFLTELIALRKRHARLRRRRFLTGRPVPGRLQPDVSRHGERPDEPRWHDPDARVLAFTLAGDETGEPPLHVILDMHDVPREAALPALDRQSWAVSSIPRRKVRMTSFSCRSRLRSKRDTAAPKHAASWFWTRSERPGKGAVAQAFAENA